MRKKLKIKSLLIKKSYFFKILLKTIFLTKLTKIALIIFGMLLLSYAAVTPLAQGVFEAELTNLLPARNVVIRSYLKGTDFVPGQDWTYREIGDGFNPHQNLIEKSGATPIVQTTFGPRLDGTQYFEVMPSLNSGTLDSLGIPSTDADVNSYRLLGSSTVGDDTDDIDVNDIEHTTLMHFYYEGGSVIISVLNSGGGRLTYADHFGRNISNNDRGYAGLQKKENDRAPATSFTIASTWLEDISSLISTGRIRGSLVLEAGNFYTLCIVKKFPHTTAFLIKTTNENTSKDEGGAPFPEGVYGLYNRDGSDNPWRFRDALRNVTGLGGPGYQQVGDNFKGIIYQVLSLKGAYTLEELGQIDSYIKENQYGKITSIFSNNAAGSIATIRGERFGASSAIGRNVLFDSRKITAETWSDTEVSFRIPNDAQVGIHKISVQTSFAAGSEIDFTVAPQPASLGEEILEGELTSLLSGRSVVIRSYLKGTDFVPGQNWPYRETGDGFNPYQRLIEKSGTTPIAQTTFGPRLDGTQYFEVTPSLNTNRLDSLGIPSTDADVDSYRLLGSSASGDYNDIQHTTLMHFYYEGGSVILSVLDSGGGRLTYADHFGQTGLSTFDGGYAGLQKKENDRAPATSFTIASTRVENISGSRYSGRIRGGLVLEAGNFYTLCIVKKFPHTTAFLIKTTNAANIATVEGNPPFPEGVYGLYNTDTGWRFRSALNNIIGLGGPGYQQLGDNFKGIIYQVLSLKGAYTLEELGQIDSYIKENQYSKITNIFSDGGGDPLPSSIATIRGERFGASSAIGRNVLFDSRKITAETWSDTEVSFRIPSDAQAGTHKVSVETSFAPGNEIDFTVVPQPASLGENTFKTELENLLPGRSNVVIRNYLKGTDFVLGQNWPYRETGDGFNPHQRLIERSGATPIAQTTFGPRLDGTQYFEVIPSLNSGRLNSLGIPINNDVDSYRLLGSSASGVNNIEHTTLMHFYYEGGSVILSVLDSGGGRLTYADHFGQTGGNAPTQFDRGYAGLQKKENDRAPATSFTIATATNDNFGSIYSGKIRGSLVLEAGNFYTLCIVKKVPHTTAFLIKTTNAANIATVEGNPPFPEGVYGLYNFDNGNWRFSDALRNVTGLGGPGYQQVGDNFKGIIYQVLSLKGAYTLEELGQIDSYIKENQYSKITSIFSDGGTHPLSASNAGSVATIRGERFGASSAIGRNVLFDSRKITAETWSDTEVSFRIPSDAQAGTHKVSVETSFAPGNEIDFTVVPQPASLGENTFKTELENLLPGRSNVVIRNYLKGTDFVLGQNWPYRETGDGFNPHQRLIERSGATPIAQTTFGPRLDGTQYFEVIPSLNSGRLNSLGIPINNDVDSYRLLGSSASGVNNIEHTTLMHFYYEGGSVILSVLDSGGGRLTYADHFGQTGGNAPTQFDRGYAGLQKKENDRAPATSFTIATATSDNFGSIYSGKIRGSLVLEAGNFYTLCIVKKVPHTTAFLIKTTNAANIATVEGNPPFPEGVYGLYNFDNGNWRFSDALRNVTGLGGPGYQQVGDNFKGIIYQVLSLKGAYTLEELGQIDSYIKENQYSKITSIFSDGGTHPLSASNAGSVATIRGERFGASSAIGRNVLFDSRKITAETWSDTEVLFRIPSDAQAGTHKVSVETSFAPGNEIDFTVIVTTPPPPPPPPPLESPSLGEEILEGELTNLLPGRNVVIRNYLKGTDFVPGRNWPYRETGDGFNPHQRLIERSGATPIAQTTFGPRLDGTQYFEVMPSLRTNELDSLGIPSTDADVNSYRLLGSSAGDVNDIEHTTLMHFYYEGGSVILSVLDSGGGRLTYADHFGQTGLSDFDGGYAGLQKKENDRAPATSFTIASTWLEDISPSTNSGKIRGSLVLEAGNFYTLCIVKKIPHTTAFLIKTTNANNGLDNNDTDPNAQGFRDALRNVTGLGGPGYQQIGDNFKGIIYQVLSLKGIYTPEELEQIDSYIKENQYGKITSIFSDGGGDPLISSNNAGSVATIRGERFGASSAIGRNVLFDSRKITAETWSDTEVSFRIPNDAQVGIHKISVETSFAPGNEIDFTVVPFSFELPPGNHPSDGLEGLPAATADTFKLGVSKGIVVYKNTLKDENSFISRKGFVRVTLDGTSLTKTDTIRILDGSRLVYVPIIERVVGNLNDFENNRNYHKVIFRIYENNLKDFAEGAYDISYQSSLSRETILYKNGFFVVDQKGEGGQNNKISFLNELVAPRDVFYNLKKNAKLYTVPIALKEISVAETTVWIVDINGKKLAKVLETTLYEGINNLEIDFINNMKGKRRLFRD